MVVNCSRNGGGEGHVGDELTAAATADRRLDLGGADRRSASSRPRRASRREREMALGLHYLRAVEAAGGLPVVMPPLRARRDRAAARPPAAASASRAAPTSHPAAYGRSAAPELGPTEPELDGFELALAREADARELPILAICRGTQVLNVAARRHAASSTSPSARTRRSSTARPAAASASPTTSRSSRGTSAGAHRSAPARIASTPSTTRRSSRLGGGLRAVAWAPDGIVEAIEADRARFLRRRPVARREPRRPRPSTRRSSSAFVEAARDGTASLERAAGAHDHAAARRPGRSGPAGARPRPTRSASRRR